MKFGLKESTIDKVNSVFLNHLEIDEVIVFGSRAKGNFREGSDIDLTLIGKNIKYEKLSKIKQQIDDLNTPYLFDISIFETLKSEDFINHIIRVGQTFYKKQYLQK